MNKGRTIQVLVVDDEASSRSGLALLFKQEGYAVDTAADGLSALAVVAENPPDLVVTDLRMPGMDGLALLEALRESHPEVPVIMVTAHGDVSAAVKAMQDGAADYVPKPVDFDELLVAAERAIQVRHLRLETVEWRRQLREQDEQDLEGLIGSSLAIEKV